MSQTWKDSARQSTHRTVLEVTKNSDGTYEIVFNDEVVGRGFSKDGWTRSFAQNGDSAEKNLPQSNVNIRNLVEPS